MKKRVVFVCLGNICRSPMAEGLFLHLVEKKGLSGDFEVDSAGTAGYHTGEKPDKRMRETAGNHGVHLPSRARHFVADDFERFDYVVAMDDSNVNDIKKLDPSNHHASKLFKMRDFDDIDKGGNVPDPYYGGMNGFDEVYHMLLRCNANFLQFLETK